MRSAKSQNFSPVTTGQVSQPKARLSTWGRMLVAGCIIGSLFAPTALEAGGRKDKEIKKPGVTRLAKANSNSRSKNKKKPEIVTASRWVTIPNSNCQPCKLVMRTRDDWDYVEIGVDFTPKNNKDRIDFGRFSLSGSDAQTLKKRILTIGKYGWAMTGPDDNGVYHHLIVNGFHGPEVTNCLVALKGLALLEKCGLKAEASFDDKIFIWSLFRNGRVIGRMRESLSCETIESLSNLPTDSNDCPTDGKRASLK